MNFGKMPSKQNKALVVANGELHLDYLQKIVTSYNLVICADGAAEKLKAIGAVPDVLVGDFDSIQSEVLDYFAQKSVKQIVLEPEKDFSDTHVAVELAMDRGYQEIDIVGGFGGRWDHSIANFNLLYYGYSKKLKRKNGDDAQKNRSTPPKIISEIEITKEKCGNVQCAKETNEEETIFKKNITNDKYFDAQNFQDRSCTWGNFKIRLISENNIAEIFGVGEHDLLANFEEYWSCFAIFEDATISIQNMKYPLAHKKILRGESIGLSNEFLQGDGKLIVEQGSVVVIRSNKD